MGRKQNRTKRSKNKYIDYLQDREGGCFYLEWGGLPSYNNKEADFLQIVKEMNDIIDWYIVQLDVTTNDIIYEFNKEKIDQMIFFKNMFISRFGEENNEIR